MADDMTIDPAAGEATAGDPVAVEPVDPVADQVLDGNAVAGVLAAAFGAEMTAVPGECAHCGTVNVVAAMRAYVRAPGTVLRCPACGGVVLRIVETPTATLVDVRGAAWLQFERR